VGKPDLKGFEDWTWHPTKPDETTIFFTHKGNVCLWDRKECKTLQEQRKRLDRTTP
jgi:hypothetical protein